jgi:octaprenyl-diphosphate synthase
MLATQTGAATTAAPIEGSSDSAVGWKQVIGMAEPFLQAVAQRLADQIHAFDPEIATYAEYALTGQGKQLRPALVALSGGATGNVNDNHVMAAVIIEMVHLATLVHDDICDEAQIRRGRPTLASNWGNEVSVLLGDCLFAHALKLAASFPTPDICRAVAAATNTVCAGEILQTQRCKYFELSLPEYFKAVSMKTGELFALSCDLGAFLSGAEPAQRTALRQYGMAAGTAYQVFDDCVDLFGSEIRAGKSLGTDLAKGKLTLPMLLLVERAEAAEKAKLKGLVENWDPAFFPQVLRLLRKYQTLEESCRHIEEFLDVSRQALSPLPQSENRAGLFALTGYLTQQTKALRVSN